MSSYYLSEHTRLEGSASPDDLDEIDGLFFESEGEAYAQRGKERDSRIVAMISPKGGTGKTSIAINLAGLLATRRRTAAVMDLDPRASALRWADTGRGFDFDVHVFGAGRGAAAFRRSVHRYLELADILILDTPPTMGPPIRLALQVADLVLIPVGPSVLDLAAAQEAIGAAREARHGRAGNLPQVVLVPARQVTRSRVAKELQQKLKSLDVPVTPTLTQRVEVAEAASSGRLVRPGSPAGAEYQRLARHVLYRLKRLDG